LTWDDADRLKEDDGGGVATCRFRYNPDGERTQRQDRAGLTNFYFNQFLVMNGNKNVTKHIFAGDTRIASRTEIQGFVTPVKHFYHGDQVGSTAYITDDNKALVQHERYFPFGESWEEAGGSINGISTMERDTTKGPFRTWLFTSKELDTDTGYYYYGARYYDPRMARWLSPDPILASYMKGEPNGGGFNPKNLNLYSYAHNNPVILRDPDGRWPDAWNPLGEGGQFVQDTAKAIAQGIESGLNRAGRFVADKVAGRVAAAILSETSAGALLMNPGRDELSNMSSGSAGPASPAPSQSIAPSPAGASATQSGPRFVGEPNGTVVDVQSTPPGSYDQPGIPVTNGTAYARTDVLQASDHGAGHSHTHDPILNQSPDGRSFVGAGQHQKPGRPVSAQEVENIRSGAAVRSAGKGR